MCLPGHVRDHHRGADLRRDRRAHALRRLRRVHHAVGARRLRPVAHWVWGGGWLAKMGALDFAGGTVVHVNAGVAALVAAMVRRPAQGLSRARRSCRTTCRSRCSAPACCGSAGSASTPAARSPPTRIAALAFTTTMLAPAATLVVWTLLDLMRTRQGRPRSARATGDRRRPGRDHAGGRLRQPDERDRARRAWPRSRATSRCSGARSTRARRLARRRRGARRRRHGRRAADRRVRAEGAERRRRRRAVRQPGAARHPGDGRAARRSSTAAS